MRSLAQIVRSNNEAAALRLKSIITPQGAVVTSDTHEVTQAFSTENPNPHPEDKLLGYVAVYGTPKAE
jgi:hypothetical protein